MLAERYRRVSSLKNWMQWKRIRMSQRRRTIMKAKRRRCLCTLALALVHIPAPIRIIPISITITPVIPIPIPIVINSCFVPCSSHWRLFLYPHFKWKKSLVFAKRAKESWLFITFEQSVSFLWISFRSIRAALQPSHLYVSQESQPDLLCSHWFLTFSFYLNNSYLFF